jgi:hypothetical protein
MIPEAGKQPPQRGGWVLIEIARKLMHEGGLFEPIVLSVTTVGSGQG